LITAAGATFRTRCPARFFLGCGEGAIVNPRFNAPSAAETARRSFFAAIDHTDASHRSVSSAYIPWEDATVSPFPVEHNRAGKNVTDHCGWWWCAEPDPSAVKWDDLTKALAVLRDGDIDPWSEKVAWVAQRHRGVESWISERRGFENLQRALKKLTGLGPTGDRLRSKWMSELFPYLGVAREKVPPRKPRTPGRNRKVSDWVALEQAEEYSMSADHVAAILVLTGESKGGFASVMKALRQLDVSRRSKLASVR
jgi:hypothetical protein